MTSLVCPTSSDYCTKLKLLEVHFPWLNYMYYMDEYNYTLSSNIFTWAEKHKSVTFDSIFVIKFQRLSNRMLPCESLFEYVFDKFDQRFLNKTKFNFK